MLSIIYLFIVTSSFLYLNGLYNEFTYRKKAKKMGASLPAHFSDHPAGIPGFLRLAYNSFKMRIPEYIKEGIESTGVLTFRNQALFDTDIITVDPENIKAMLATQFNDFTIGRRRTLFLPFLGTGIFSSQGEGWKHARALLRPQFVRQNVSQLTLIEKHTEKFLELCKKKNEAGYFNIKPWLIFLTFDTASEFLMGTSVNALDRDAEWDTVASDEPNNPHRFIQDLQSCVRIVTIRARVGAFYKYVNPPWFKVKIQHCRDFVDGYVEKALKDYDDGKLHGERFVLAEALVKQTRDVPYIRDQLFSVLLAGRDTTAALLAYSIYRFGMHKKYFFKLREIVLHDFGYTHHTITFESLKKCFFLQYFMNEVLRLNPVVAMNWRQAEHDTLLPRGGGPDESEPILVPKGTNVHFPQYVIHRLKRFWGEDANEFRPERWEEGHPHPWEYIPFNGGPRICIGQQFSQTEAAYILVRLLQNFKDLTVIKHKSDSNEPNVWIQLLASIEKCEVHFELVDEDDIADHVARGVTEHPDKVNEDFLAREKQKAN